MAFNRPKADFLQPPFIIIRLFIIWNVFISLLYKCMRVDRAVTNCGNKASPFFCLLISCLGLEIQPSKYCHNKGNLLRISSETDTREKFSRGLFLCPRKIRCPSSIVRKTTGGRTSWSPSPGPHRMACQISRSSS